MLRNLGDIRKQHKMTQAELGQLVGVSQRAIAAYEAGERKPSPRVMNKLMQELDIPLNEAWQMLYSDEQDQQSTDEK